MAWLIFYALVFATKFCSERPIVLACFRTLCQIILYNLAFATKFHSELLFWKYSVTDTMDLAFATKFRSKRQVYSASHYYFLIGVRWSSLWGLANKAAPPQLCAWGRAHVMYLSTRSASWRLIGATWRHFWILTYATGKSGSKSASTWHRKVGYKIGPNGK
jgi:hypothetical protein